MSHKLRLGINIDLWRPSAMRAGADPDRCVLRNCRSSGADGITAHLRRSPPSPTTTSRACAEISHR
jgi:hypothetical protein